MGAVKANTEQRDAGSSQPDGDQLPQVSRVDKRKTWEMEMGKKVLDKIDNVT